MKFHSILALAAALLLGSASLSAATAVADYRVVPLPAKIQQTDAPGFTLDAKTAIVYPSGNKALEKNATLLAGYLKTLTGLNLRVTDRAPRSGAIVLSDNLKNDNREAYELTADRNRIVINGASAAGNFYGCQTLRKAIPGAVKGGKVTFPAVTVSDAPRFGYRGGHLDVARHMFTPDSIRMFIDMLALHNANNFHWHLTDDQGWRIDIKRFPRLAELSSMRQGTCYNHDFTTSDSIPYGGYYTQDEIRDIIQYAADRHINVIPEIDLPGHMIAALKAYPELGCTGGPYETWTRWGVSDDLLCAGNDSTLAFIDGVLTEIMDLFPSELIHVGGDECPKTKWEQCPKCQARIEALGLVNDSHSTKEQKLQTYVMTHASNTLASRGRKMIGWDEILEGGLTPGAVVMSWRGAEGGLQAAQVGHDAIMTPTNYCYFDYYQTLDRTGEPDAIGGYVPLETVFNYNPVPSSFTPEQAAHILGAQANLWTEYITSMDHVFYQELPRYAALSEVQWRQPEGKDYTEFTHRLPHMMKHYDALGMRYARHIFDVRGTLTNDPADGVIICTMETADNAPIHYTLDGTTPIENSPLYTEPLRLDKTCTVKSLAFRPEGTSKMYADSVTFSKSTSRAVTLGNEPHSRYPARGAATLTDGRMGPADFNTGDWIGFEGKDIVATIDLVQPTQFSSVTIRNNVNTPNWIFDARSMTVEISDDGQIFTEVAHEEYPVLQNHVESIVTHTLSFPAKTARYVRVTETCEKSIPEFHGVGAGKVAFIFADEIIID